MTTSPVPQPVHASFPQPIVMPWNSFLLLKQKSSQMEKSGKNKTKGLGNKPYRKKYMKKQRRKETVSLSPKEDSVLKKGQQWSHYEKYFSLY